MSDVTEDKADQTGYHRGRYLDASRDVALRNAALELLSEIGYDRLTIDAIAARAGAGKTTIYRRWPGKAELVVDALNCHSESMMIPDTGSLRGDLEAIARSSSSMHNQFDAQVMLGLITALAHDAGLRQVFREKLMDPHAAELKQVFERAITRGEVSKDRNLELLVPLFRALVIQQLLISGELPDVLFAEQVMNDVIFPLATAPVSAPLAARTRRSSHVDRKLV
jgi:AcrR family transcriptional regulator